MKKFSVFCLSIFTTLASFGQGKTVYLHELDLSSMVQGWSNPRVNLNMRDKPILLGGKEYKGVGTHASSSFMVDLGEGAERFKTVAGLDDWTADKGGNAVFFKLIGDSKILYKSDTIKPGDAPKNVDISLVGVKIMQLFVQGVGGETYHTHFNWGDAKFEGVKSEVKPYIRPIEPTYILTPKPSDIPKINGPKVYGARPGNPFMYRIPVTGQKPITFEAVNLPLNLELNPRTGIITGSVPQEGAYYVKLIATNALGKSERELKIMIGQKIGLTPVLGWNSWNCWGMAVDESKIKAAADFMISSGLADHGWSYINVDDGWQGLRDSIAGSIESNPETFPSMKGLANYIHQKGLKAGLYTSPGPLTCGGKAGSYKFEFNDAQQYGAWGFDYLKHDYCSYKKVAPDLSLMSAMKPYRTMYNALRHVKRDIIYSLCQYGQNDVWKWGADVGGNSWRTTGDISDTYMSVLDISERQSKYSAYAKPGGFNDPDMLVVGQLGWGPQVRPTRLSPNEQYYHISLWSMLAAPMLLGCDLSKLDEFTLNLLTNDEVIDINQDALGRQAVCVFQDNLKEIWVKNLEDGSKAVGLFNKSLNKQKISLPLEKINMKGKRTVRDVWRQKDLSPIENILEAEVVEHGVYLVKIH